MADVYKQSFKQNYTNNIELSIFNCGIERCAPSKTWGPGIRDHYLIHLVLSGKGEFEVGGRTWQVSTGDLFFARPSQLIRYTADEQYPWEYSWVGFNGACILFKHIEKQVYRFILLITKQEVNPRYVITRQAVGFILLVLLRTSAAHIPAIGSGYRQKQKQQLQHRKLFLRR